MRGQSSWLDCMKVDWLIRIVLCVHSKCSCSSWSLPLHFLRWRTPRQLKPLPYGNVVLWTSHHMEKLSNSDALHSFLHAQADRCFFSMAIRREACIELNQATADSSLTLWEDFAYKIGLGRRFCHLFSSYFSKHPVLSMVGVGLFHAWRFFCRQDWDKPN